MTARELAHSLGARLEGSDCELTGAAALDEAGQRDLCFVAAEKSFEAAAHSASRCLIAQDGFAPSAGQAVIRSRQPRALFARALEILYPARVAEAGIHATAQIASHAAIDPSAEVGPLCSVGAGASVGKRTRIGPGCHIGSDVQIGSDCLFHAGVILYDRVRVGDRVILHSGCVLGADGFGFAQQEGSWVKFPQVGSVEIESDVEIGANSCVDRAALGWTRIRIGAKLDNMVHVGHNCDIGRHVVVAAQTGFSGGVLVGDGAVIGGQAGIGDKVRIEPGVVLGSGSGVFTSKLVRRGQPLWGTPARPLRAHLEQLALVARLPRFRDSLRDLLRRVERLEKDRP